MSSTLQLNGQAIETDTIYISLLEDGRRHVACDFQVTSEAYHDIAVLLYEINFKVHLPEEGLTFDASITNYFTDTTNLYEGNKIAVYHLELTENTPAV